MLIDMGALSNVSVPEMIRRRGSEIFEYLFSCLFDLLGAAVMGRMLYQEQTHRSVAVRCYLFAYHLPDSILEAARSLASTL